MPSRPELGAVSMLFSDIEGSTLLLERAGERYPELLAAHHRLLRAAWSAHGGREQGTEGDAFFVLFDDAADAVAAARRAQHELRTHPWPPEMAIRVRMGVHTGRVERREGNLWGADIHYAARLASGAHGGQVLISEATRALVDTDAVSLGEHVLKDFPEPRPIFQLVIDGAGPEAFPPPRTLSRVTNNLPAPGTPLIARESELGDVAWRVSVAGRRLVTLTGPGGSGKTRLAIAVARRVLGAFPDGVYFVALDEVSDPGAVPVAIQRALELPDVPGVATVGRVLGHVAPRRVLIVLDNLEHLLEAAPIAGQLVEAGEDVHVLATSQAPLRLPGEEIVPVAPLAVPTGRDADLDALARVPSVALLVERARGAAPGFRLTEANAAAVHELCVRLDGLPLALELAAARFGIVGPEELVRRLDMTLDALGTGGRGRPDRQRGLRAMLDWTCGLLTDTERRALARLSVFVGGFTLELAESGMGDVLDDLATLHDVQLVRRDEAGRFSMAPPVRRYATELLDTDGERAAAYRGLVMGVTTVGARWEDAWFLRLTDSAPALNAEAANIVAALTWSRTAEPALHADLAAAVGWWLRYSGRADAAAEHLTAARAAAGDDSRLLARIDEALGVGGPASVDPDAPMRAAEAWRALGDRRRLTAALWNVANNHSHFRRAKPALRAAEEGLAIARELGDEDLLVGMQTQVGWATFLDGRPDEALALLESLLPHARRGGARAFLPWSYLADVQLAAGRPAEALPSFAQTLRALRGAGIPTLEIIEADSIAVALGQVDRADDAATALALSEMLHGQHALPIIGVADAYTAVDAGLASDVRDAGRARAARIGVAGAIEWLIEAAER
jgi:predicted ATPase/class 3 adenylate cyclase